MAVDQKQKGRRKGFSPINGAGGTMVKKQKAWHMPATDWQWLEEQPNQSRILRGAIALYRQNQTNEQTCN